MQIAYRHVRPIITILLNNLSSLVSSRIFLVAAEYMKSSRRYVNPARSHAAAHRTSAPNRDLRGVSRNVTTAIPYPTQTGSTILFYFIPTFIFMFSRIFIHPRIPSRLQFQTNRFRHPCSMSHPKCLTPKSAT